MIDYMVMEAVAIKVKTEDERLRKEAEKTKEREEFKKAASSALDKYK